MASNEQSRAAAKRERSESPLFEPQDTTASQTDHSSNKRAKISADDASKTAEALQSFNLDADHTKGARFTSGRPRLAVYHTLYPEAEQAVTTVCDNFSLVLRELKAANYSNEDVENIAKQLEQFRNPREHYPRNKPVALVGPMGAGKSRLINCLLEQRGAALDSDSADRGTNVVHEYLAPEHGQTEEFRVNAVYYSDSQMQDRVKAKCFDIYNFYTKEAGDESGEEVEGDDLDDLRTKHDNAVNFFHVVLCDKESFETIEETEEFFREQHKEELEEADLVKELMRYLKTFKASRNIVDGIESYAAADDDELLEVFNKVSKPLLAAGEDAKDPHPWPMIRKIEIHHDKDMLNVGVMLADTPGVTDSDQTVVNSTHTYLDSVGTILIVAQRLRNAKHTELDEVLKICLRKNKAANTYLVMTKIDQKDDLKPHERKKLHVDVRTRLEKAETKVVELKAERTTLNHKKEDLWKRGMQHLEVQDEFREVETRLNSLPRLTTEAEAEVFQIAVEVGNANAEADMRNKFRQLSRSPKAPDLKVIFVSASEFQNHLFKPDAVKLPREATGIPGLQHLLYGVPASGKFRTLYRIATIHLPAIFDGIVGTLTTTRLERKGEVQKVLSRALSAHTDLIDSLDATIHVLFATHIEDLFVKNGKAWRDKLDKKFNEWKAYHSGTFWAFLRRYGKWQKGKKADKKDKISWINIIQTIFGKEVTEAFDAFLLGLDQVKSDAESGVRDYFREIEMKLKACPDYQSMAQTKKGEEFFKMLHKTRDDVIDNLNKLFESRRRHLGTIATDATVDTWEHQVPISYVGKALIPTFDVAKEIKPKPGTYAKRRKNVGPHADRVEVMRKALFGSSEVDAEGEVMPNIFQAVFDAAKKEFGEQRASLGKKLREKLEECGKEVKKDFGRRYVVKEDAVAPNPEMVGKLLEAARGAVGELGEVERMLRICEAWEKEGGVAA